MTTQGIQIVDRRNNNRLVEAILHEELQPLQVAEAEKVWGPLRRNKAKEMHWAGKKVPEHWRWNWESKSAKIELLAIQCFGIEYNKEMQGMMLVNTISRARLTPHRGKPLVYIEYIESAPWNTKVFEDNPRFAGIRTRLFEAAIRLSLSEGYLGRVGLHSLPQSIDFYTNKCNMTDVCIDKEVEGLTYFELTPSNADKFIQGGEDD